MKATREQVYAVIDGERDYQDRKWSEDTTASGGKHSPAEWVLYMENYLEEARKYATRLPEPVSSRMVLDTIRKIAAMGVACMEQNGARPRTEARPMGFQS